MFEAQEHILNQLRAGGDGVSEFKTLKFGRHGVIDPAVESMDGEMVAFANAAGGTLFLGIDDEGGVEGIPRDRQDGVQAWVANIAAQNCEPPIRPTIRLQTLDDAVGNARTVMLVEVPRGIYVHRTTGGRYYLRVGSTKRDLRPPELARLFQERGRDYVFDEQTAHGATVAELDRHRLEAHFGRSPAIPWLDLLRNTGVTRRDEHGEDRPTIAGLLVFGREPTRHLPSAFVEAACYGGTRLASEDLLHAEQLSGPLAEQIDGAIAFADHFMHRGRSSATVPYDIEVVDEAVVNAAAHRDYALSGSKIRLFLFADRLELYSPGGLPNTITLEDMAYRTHTRNQLLVSFLSRIRSRRTGDVFLESRGEGVRKILEGGQTHSGRMPKYELFGEELRLTIWASVEEPAP